MKLKSNSLSLLLGYFILILLQQIAFQFIHNNDLLYPVQTILNLLGAISLIWLTLHFKYKNKLEEKKAVIWQSLLWMLGGVIIVLTVQRVLLWFETAFLQQPVISENTSQLMAVAGKYPYYLLIIVFTEPIIEELIYRKVLFGNFSYWFKPWQTALFSSLLFALGHGDGHFLTYTAIGLIFCLVYERTGKIQGSMATHILMNLLVLLLN